MSDDKEQATENSNPSVRPLRELDGSGMRKERRVIKRVSDSELRKNAKQVRVASQIIAITCFTFAAALLLHHFYGNSLELTRSLFLSTLCVVEGASFQLLSQAAGSYAENESVARMTKFMERLTLLLITTATLTTLFAAVQIGSWIW